MECEEFGVGRERPFMSKRNCVSSGKRRKALFCEWRNIIVQRDTDLTFKNILLLTKMHRQGIL